MKKEFRTAKKMLPKLVKRSEQALAAKKYDETVAIWKALLQTAIDARETDHLNSYVTKIYSAVQDQVNATSLCDRELYHFINSAYSSLIKFLSDLHHKELPVSTIRAHLMDTHPVQIVVLEKYSNLLAEAAILFYAQKHYSETIMSLLGAIKQLTAYIDLTTLLQKSDPKSNVLSCELEIARMRQAIYYSICIKCRRLVDPEIDVSLLQIKGTETYKSVTQDDKKDHPTFAKMKKMMQGFVWLMCTENLADPHNQADDYYLLKAKGLELLWRLLLVGTSKLDYLLFDDIKTSAETLHATVSGLVTKNHLTALKTGRLYESQLIFQQILFSLQLDNYDINNLEKDYTEMARLGNLHKCSLSAETSAFYHYRAAALLLKHLDITNACLQISLAKRYAQQIDDNPLIQLRIQITAMMIEVTDSAFTELPTTTEKAHAAFQLLISTAKNRPHIRALYQHYRETLAIALHFYINLQLIYN
nr:hypothetical protein [Pseudomonadota bacterium]